MSQIPEDLVPIPTQPWDTRPDALPLDTEECRTAIWMHQGNITNAAKHLKINPQRLRNYVKKSPYLSREMDEARETMLDKAEENIWDALESDDDVRRDNMTKFVYNTFGRVRGFGQGSTNVKVDVNASGPISISWDNGQALSSPENMGDVIEGTLADE